MSSRLIKTARRGGQSPERSSLPLTAAQDWIGSLMKTETRSHMSMDFIYVDLEEAYPQEYAFIKKKINETLAN